MADSTTNSIKDFDALIADKRRNDGTGPVFLLLGKEWKCLSGIPAWKMGIFAASDSTFMDSFDFLCNLIQQDQREAFTETVKDDVVTIEVLNAIIQWVMESYSGRPTNEDGS